MAGGARQRVSFSFVADVRARTTPSPSTWPARARSCVTRLGSRTDEFTALLDRRGSREARSRTSAFLGSLLPGLDPMALRAAAGLLRDGVAVPARALDARPPRARRHAAAGRRRCPTGSRAVAGPRGPGGPGDRVQAGDLGAPGRGRRHALARPAATPHIGAAREPGRAFRPGLGGVMAAGVMSGLGPGGGLGGYGPGGYGGRRVRRVRLRRPVRRRSRWLRRVRRLLGVPRARRRR